MSYEIINALYKCSLTSSSNEKLEYLNSIKEYPEFKRLCEIIFDPFTTFGAYPSNKFGLKSEPKIPILPFEQTNIKSVVLTMEALASRSLVGNEARKAIENLIESYNESWRPWIYSFFHRELTAGVSEGLIKRIYPGIIFDREVQLADGYNSDQLAKDNWWAEPKLDGMRVVFLKSGEEYLAMSRSFKPLHLGNFLHIIEEIKPILSKYIAIDCEVMYEKDWSKSISVAKTKFDHPNRLGLKAYIFDFFPAAAIKDKSFEFTMPYEERRKLLSNYLLNGPFSHCFLTYSSYMGNDIRRITNLKNYYVNKGYEGLVLKKVNSTYNFGRDGQWMKAKKSGRDDFKILTAIPGTGKLSKPPSLEMKKMLYSQGSAFFTMEAIEQLTCAMGALVVEVNGIPSNVGTGFSEYTRYELMLRHNVGLLEGRWAEIEYHSITKDSALREPVYLDLRIDK